MTKPSSGSLAGQPVRTASHLSGPQPQLCDEQGIHPTLFYGWQKALFENGAAVFDGPRQRNSRQEDAAAKRVEALTDKLRRKDEVLSELMEEHVALKKSLGEA